MQSAGGGERIALGGRLAAMADEQQELITSASVDTIGELVYNFTMTITQNLKAGQQASGRARLSVSGIQAGKLATLAWNELASGQDRAGLGFSFKYFQQLKGALMLPAGFTPNRIHAEADGGGDLGRAEQDFAWSEALSTPEATDVQQ